MTNLIQKYNIPGPRYTSYPTVPFWDKKGIALNDWKETVVKSFMESNDKEGISLYIHLPFCESLCTFCACHKKISTYVLVHLLQNEISDHIYYNDIHESCLMQLILYVSIHHQ